MAYELFVWMDKWTRSLIPPQVAAHEFVPYIPGIGVVMLIVVLILIGMFTTGFIGRFFVRLGDFIVSKMPLISSIYSLLKQLFETVFSQKSKSFKEAVFWNTRAKASGLSAFWPAKRPASWHISCTAEMLSIFVPTTPNPTSGFLIIVPSEDVIKLKMSVEDALKYVVPAVLSFLKKKKKNCRAKTVKIRLKLHHSPAIAPGKNG